MTDLYLILMPYLAPVFQFLFGKRAVTGGTFDENCQHMQSQASVMHHRGKISDDEPLSLTTS